MATKREEMDAEYTELTVRDLYKKKVPSQVRLDIQMKDSPPLSESKMTEMTGYFTSGRKMKLGDIVLFGLLTKKIKRGNFYDIKLQAVSFHEEEVERLYTVNSDIAPPGEKFPVLDKVKNA